MNDKPVNILELEDGRSIVHYHILDFSIYEMSYIFFLTFFFILILIFLLRINRNFLQVKLETWSIAIICVLLRIFIPGELFFSVPICSLGIPLSYFFDIVRKPIFRFFNFNINIELLFLFIWFVGTVFFTAIYFFKNIKISKIIKSIPDTANDDYLIQLKKKLNCKFKTKLIKSSSIPAPSEYGFFSHCILLNDYPYSKSELKYIYAHELFHFKYKTHWIKFIVDILSVFFWWNPIFYLLKKINYELIELFVDEKVIKFLPNSSKSEYLKTIEKVYNCSSENSTLENSPINSMVFKNDINIIYRFKKIVDNKKNYFPINCTIILLTVIYIYISLRFTSSPQWEPSDFSEKEEISTNAYIYKEGDEYILFNDGEEYRQWDPANSPNIPIIEGGK